MKVKTGDLIIEYTGYGFYVRTIKSRTKSTVATDIDKRGRLNNYRFVDDKDKVKRILEIENQRETLRHEANNLYHSMPEIE